MGYSSNFLIQSVKTPFPAMTYSRKKLDEQRFPTKVVVMYLNKEKVSIFKKISFDFKLTVKFYL